MIISGGSRSNWRFFSKHLAKTEENERVSITEIRGLAADDIREAFREMDALASGTRCKNFFYHANINPRADELLTSEQWEQAIDTLETELGLEGHSRLVVEHEKEGRTHRHVIWSRIDTDSMTATSDSNNYAAHERAARQLEQAFGHEAVEGVHSRDPDKERPDRRPENWETFRGHGSSIDPQQVKEELSELWRRADSGKAFAAAIEERGYLLAKGDRRDFCVVDQAGDAHSLARRIDGAKAKDIRERLADIDRDALPTVAEAGALARARAEQPQTTSEIAADRENADPARENGPRSDDRGSDGPDLGYAEKIAHVAAEAILEGEGTQAGDAFDRFASDVKSSMRENAGSPRFIDGLNFWERAVAVLAVFAVVAEAFSWAKGQWQNFVAHARATPEPTQDDPGRER